MVIGTISIFSGGDPARVSATMTIIACSVVNVFPRDEGLTERDIVDGTVFVIAVASVIQSTSLTIVIVLDAEISGCSAIEG